MKPSVTVGGITFGHVSYDDDADVLYMSVGEPREASRLEETQGGHLVRYDASGQVHGITLVNVKWLVAQIVDIRPDYC